MEIALKVLIAYLLGSVCGSLVLGKLKGGLDVRDVGSGNAGATNALRAGGWMFALGVLIIDVGKGWLAAAVLPGLNLPGVASSMVPLPTIAVLCGFAAILGHCFPVFHGFRGGKGVGTFVGVLLALWPVGLLMVLGVWVLVLLLFGYVSVASMVAALSFAPVAWFLAPDPDRAIFTAFGVAAGAFIVFMHRSNLRNLMTGQEHCFRKIRLLPGP
ncbi:MAG: glycerol-3-phosphate 1-O-acyltransferase [Gammaproteobacteria bacterium]|nr:MAG: glycerol-3-phosphate 1-O-acyltransferase [Gammaproteobacteria bacterium]